MVYKSIIPTLGILMCALAGLGQNPEGDLRTIMQKNQVGKTYVHKSPTDTTQRTFLGFWSDKNTKLGVISEFKKVRASATWHGNSNVYFINASGKIVSTILFTMPNELPMSLKQNAFYFVDSDSILKAPFKLVGSNLFCLRPSRCYEVVHE